MDTAHQILADRKRFLQKHGTWSDDQQDAGELLLAALAYICTPGESIWPWELETFKPSHDPVVNLVKCGALVAAEGDRLLRRREAGLPVVGGFVVLGLDPEEIISDVDGLRKIANDMDVIRSSHAP